MINLPEVEWDRLKIISTGIILVGLLFLIELIF